MKAFMKDTHENYVERIKKIWNGYTPQQDIFSYERNQACQTEVHQ